MVYIMPDKKGDDETLDYVFNLAGRLNDGEIISSVISLEVEEGLTQALEETFDDTTVTVWLSGGLPDTFYLVAVVVETSEGRKLEDSFKVYVAAHR